MDLDLAQFRAPTNGQRPLSKRKRLPRHNAGQWFVKGPIPGPWIGEAAKLPGKCLHVALACWHEAEMKRQTKIKLTQTLLRRFGVGRGAGRNALTKLEAAGLVAVDRRNGRCPCVTIETAELLVS